MILPRDWTIAKRLKYIRELRGMSQVVLAKKTKLSSKTIEALEQGRRKNPEMSTLLALCSVLKVPITSFTPWRIDVPYGEEKR